MASEAGDGGLGHTLERIRSDLKTASRQQQQAAGVLLGTMAGDVLGSAVEGWSREMILGEYPDGLTEFQPCRRTSKGRAGPPAVGYYTDDFQMTLALAESLVETGTCTAEAAAGKYCEAFQGWRGYGGTARKILRALKAGTLEPRTSGTAMFPTGSFANGGAMRIAPVGLCYRNATDQVLHKAVEEALVCTHVHPEGIDGAFVLAAAVAALSQAKPTKASAAAEQSEELLALLQSKPRTDAMKQKLTILVGELSVYNTHGRPRTYYHQRVLLSVSEEFQIRALDAVCCVLWIMCTHWEVGMQGAISCIWNPLLDPYQFLRSSSLVDRPTLLQWLCLLQEPRAAVEAAVVAGGDTDTIAAMTGALCGALHGADWIPDSWLGAMENGERGRDRALEVAWRLAALDITK